MAALLSGKYRPTPGERVAVLLCGANTTAVSFACRLVTPPMLRDQADPPPPVLGLQREVAAVEFPGGVGAEPGDGAGRPLRRDVLGEVHPAHRVDAGGLDGTLHVGRYGAGAEADDVDTSVAVRSEEHTSELQSLMSNSSAGFFLKKK